MDKEQHKNKGEEGRMPPASYGNASNPSPHNEELEPAGASQLLDKKADTYLREAANIEDVPDAVEQEEAEQKMRGEG